MKIHQQIWTPDDGWREQGSGSALDGDASVVFAFGSEAAFDSDALLALRRRHPNAQLVGCSTAGQTAGDRLIDDEMIVATSVALEHSSAVRRGVSVDRFDGSRAAGVELARRFDPDGLVYVVVLSDGLHVNGSELVAGMTQVLGRSVGISGGMAGDGGRFARTLVIDGDRVGTKRVTAIGLYGDRLRVGCSAKGGWQTFGPDRRITRSEGNVLFDLDGVPALELYKRYLGPEHAARLPASGLLFPLAIVPDDDACRGEHDFIVRTMLSVDAEHQSLTFAGDVPSGARCRLMRADNDGIIEGAGGAASEAWQGIGDAGDAQLALMVSCVGRRHVLGPRVEEEIEAVREVMGAGVTATGFYSYGEIAPMPRGFGEVANDRGSVLHNETMTVTVLAEA